MPSPAPLVEFIRKYLHEGVDRFELRQLTAEGAESRVTDYRPSANGPSASAIAEILYDAAKDDGECSPGVAKYGVFAYRLGEASYAGRKTFVIEKRDTSLDDGFAPSESASVRGILAQHMRHTEAATRMALLASEGVIRMLKSENEDLRAHNRRLEGKHLEVMQIAEELLSDRDARKLEASKAGRQEDRKDAALGQLSKYVPVIMGSLGMGAPGEAMAAPASLLELKKVVSTIDDSVLAEMLKPLTDEQKMAVLRAIHDLVDREGEPAATGGPTQ